MKIENSMGLKKIIFWEPTVSPHKENLLSEISKILPDTKIICIAHQGLLSERSRLGWSVGKNEGFKLIVAPNHDEIRNIASDIENVLHIFSGIRHFSTIIQGVHYVMKANGDFAIMSEPRVAEGFLGFLRRFQSICSESLIRKRVKFVLAIGRNGPGWFSSVGYPERKIFQFAYFIDDDNSVICNDVTHKEFVVGFVGRVTKEKGVFDLVRALNYYKKCELHVVGGGDSLEELKKLSAQNSVVTRFFGVVPISRVRDLMRGFDVLVLPSTTTDDGWGVVVSEALLEGVPVIASRCVGASIVLDNNLMGYVVRPRRPEDIFRALVQIESRGLNKKIFREKRKAIACSLLTAKSGAKYFKSILENIYNGNARPETFFKI